MKNITKEEITKIVEKNSESAWTQAMQNTKDAVDKMPIENLTDAFAQLQITNRIYTENLIISCLLDIFEQN